MWNKADIRAVLLSCETSIAPFGRHSQGSWISAKIETNSVTKANTCSEKHKDYVEIFLLLADFTVLDCLCLCFCFSFCPSFSFSFCSLMLAEMTVVWMAWVPQFSSSRYTKTWFHNRRRKTRSYQQTADWQRNWEINWKYWNRKWVSWDWYVLYVQMSNLPIIPLVRC